MKKLPNGSKTKALKSLCGQSFLVRADGTGGGVNGTSPIFAQADIALTLAWAFTSTLAATQTLVATTGTAITAITTTATTTTANNTPAPAANYPVNFFSRITTKTFRSTRSTLTQAEPKDSPAGANPGDRNHKARI